MNMIMWLMANQDKLEEEFHNQDAFTRFEDFCNDAYSYFVDSLDEADILDWEMTK